MSKDPTTTPQRAALIALKISCPECDQEIEIQELGEGKNPGQTVTCSWDNEQLRVPDILVKSP